jgi:hypothetical protein
MRPFPPASIFFVALWGKMILCRGTMAKKQVKQVRLEPDVAKKAATEAKLNSRSVPKEVNHTLRSLYRLTAN